MIIGHVMLTPPVFACYNASCANTTFTRLADLRRHYSQHHTTDKQEYFCTVPGCRRHKDGAAGGRVRKGKGRLGGKGFGVRKDKRDEHLRTVHGEKRRRTESD